LTPMGKSLVSERVVPAVSMIDQFVEAVGFEKGFIGSGHHHFRNREDTMRVDISNSCNKSHVPLLYLSSIWASFLVLSLQQAFRKNLA
jgi:hypothetical protein